MPLVPMIEDKPPVFGQLERPVVQALGGAHYPPRAARQIVAIDSLAVDRRSGRVVPARGIEDGRSVRREGAAENVVVTLGRRELAPLSAVQVQQDQMVMLVGSFRLREQDLPAVG